MKNIKLEKINSHNEWDTVKEIIVGTAKGAVPTLTWNYDSSITEDKIIKAQELCKEAYPEWYIEEVEEDLDALVGVIETFGAKVLRPTPYNQKNFFGTPDWKSNGYNSYNARDLYLVIGNSVIESPSYIESRYYEPTAYYDIFYKYFENGFKWIAGPKPLLNYEVYKPLYKDSDNKTLTEEDIKHKELSKGRVETLHKLSENEILFEAANTLRMGKDLLFLASISGNLKAAKWLKSILEPDYNVHITTEIYRSSHIDSTILALKPGLVMLNDKRVNENNCPKLFSNWDKIYFGEDIAPISDKELEFQNNVRDPIAKKLDNLGFKNNLHDMSSPWVGMNFLSLDKSTVVVDERQIKLIKVLENHKFTVIPVKMRHMYTMLGGIHCATLDTVRDSKLESYFE